ncbi:hypothetical protein [Natronoglycomyces albus]|uniref:Uncharacterized protein n=1 Tax=Natronoglycomyces albus TaxID=2811108 RepID=A0A895XVU1_9ACTN|nr:hypothetical protein [Natronoglycomyces albus]QSB06646.1 hypothetical protein JQS30_07055 [Natronoglycomyces albus]
MTTIEPLPFLLAGFVILSAALLASPLYRWKAKQAIIALIAVTVLAVIYFES